MENQVTYCSCCEKAECADRMQTSDHIVTCKVCGQPCQCVGCTAEYDDRSETIVEAAPATLTR